VEEDKIYQALKKSVQIELHWIISVADVFLQWNVEAKRNKIQPNKYLMRATKMKCTSKCKTKFSKVVSDLVTFANDGRLWRHSGECRFAEIFGLLVSGGNSLFVREIPYLIQMYTHDQMVPIIILLNPFISVYPTRWQLVLHE